MFSAKDTNKLQQVLTVSEFTAQIRVLLEDVFDHVAVVGEISNAKRYPSGHWYFSLKDKDATLPCVCFKNSQANLKFDLEDGLMVVARGKLSVYPPRGAYQLIATSLEPVGIGEWQLAFEQLKQRLEKEGLLDPLRKRPIPLLPRKIGVVTSIAGAALHDILSALRRRNRSVKILIRPAKVQGEGSAEDVAQGIVDLNELNDIDVIIVARGGGSIEDLWSFNTEVVARAVAESKIPIVSGVGHETDLTICDLVADLRAPTPTAAAELVAQGHIQLNERSGNLQRRLLSKMSQMLLDAKWSLQKLDPVRSLLRYHERLQRYQLKVNNSQLHLYKTIANQLEQAKSKLHHYHEKLLALGPLNVLGRGFAIVRNADGQIVSKSSEVYAGDTLDVLLQQGKLRVKVEACDEEWY